MPFQRREKSNGDFRSVQIRMNAARVDETTRPGDKSKWITHTKLRIGGDHSKTLINCEGTVRTDRFGICHDGGYGVIMGESQKIG